MMRLGTSSNTVPLSNSLALRIYQDTRPHKWKIANLQKGLILVCDGVEVVGASSGFGFPMLQYSHETYFSGSSRVDVDRNEDLAIIRKEFFMDRIKRNEFSYTILESEKARRLLDQIGVLYREHFRFLGLKELLVSLGVNTRFIKAEYVGKVIVTFNIRQKTVQVKVDLSQIKRRNLKKIFLLNQQGSRFFRAYLDSNGARFLDQEIGHWGIVKAEWASITDLEGKIGFRLRNLKGSVLRRGQEFIRGFLDWIGLDYEIDKDKMKFEYDIKILG